MRQPNMYAHQRGLRTTLRCIFSTHGTEMTNRAVMSGFPVRTCQTNTIADGFVILRTEYGDESDTHLYLNGADAGDVPQVMSRSRS